MFPSLFDVDDVFASFDNLVNDNRLSFGEAFPPCNIYTTEDKACVIELALAGYKKEDLSVTVKDDVVTIESKKEETEVKGNHYINHRVRTLPFIRKYSVPALDYEINDLKVTYLDGLLTIKIPHKQEKVISPKTIEIM